jgi:citrate lyase beta subunit
MTDDALRVANRAFDAAHPGERATAQPVHTVYGGAQLFRPDTAVRVAAVARAAFATWAPDVASLATAVGWRGDDPLAAVVYALVVARLNAQPVDDFRIDFEDGYGARADAEEDGHARAAGEALAAGWAQGTLPRFIGPRVKPLNEEHRTRSKRTLLLLLESLLGRTGGKLPAGFTITLPKVTVVEQVAYFVRVLADFEAQLGLPAGSLTFEIMVEAPGMIIDGAGRCPLPDVVAAGNGRITAAHFGPYDYTAALGISASHQALRHPACDHAKQVMQVALAGTGVWLSDGPTAVLPVPVHRGEAARLTPEQVEENRTGVHRAWRQHYLDVTHSLTGGFYQGWDLHPAQLVTRYAAVFAFFLSGLPAAGTRLRTLVERAAQASLVGTAFDDAATGQGLLNWFLRAIACGAITEEDARERTGLTLEELRSRSFTAILARRGAQG